MLQLTRDALRCTETPRALAAMRQAFGAHGGIRLPALLDRELLSLLQGMVARVEFKACIDEGIAREARMSDHPVLALLHLLMNDTAMFDVVQHITGAGPFKCFLGRVYRMQAGAGHFDSWHSDAIAGRLIGMSVNLSTDTYAGGHFEMRPTGSTEVQWRVANTGPGDAILFRIGADLVHRVTPVKGGAPKVSFAGWFHSHPEFLSLLKTAPARLTAAPATLSKG